MEEETICDMNRIYESLVFHVVRRKGERVDGESTLGPPSRPMSLSPSCVCAHQGALASGAGDQI